MGNCSGFCMTSNSATNQNEENTATAGGAQSKKVITADKVRQAYMEKDDMLMNEGAAGAAQYEEAYGRGGASNEGRLIGGPMGGPRKLNKPNEESGGAESGSAPQRESLRPMTLPSGAIYTGQWLNGMKDGYGHQVWPDGSKYEGEW